MLLLAAIIALCAVVVRVRPDLTNVLSDEERKRMDAKRIGRIAFWGLMTTAAILVVLYILGIRNELVPIFVVMPGALITAGLIQSNV